MAPILVTGAAGFIGFHLSRKLLEQGHQVVGLDNLNAYYDVNLKQARLTQLTPNANFTFHQIDLADRIVMADLFDKYRFERVINLAAQAGIRYSLTNPQAYVDSNVSGFLNVLEGCRHAQLKHLVFASSSSVYGANERIPFSVHDSIAHPISLYAATKASNELMAHAYAHLYQVPCTGLRFFTVYGAWGRPDMVLFLFTKAILENRPIDVFNYGRHKRDFTYIDDIVEGIVRVIDYLPEPDPNWNGNQPDPATSYAPYRLYNIGNHQPVEITYLINVLEQALGKAAIVNVLPKQPWDVLETYADVDDLARAVGFRPNTPIEEGVRRFVAWYREYYAGS